MSRKEELLRKRMELWEEAQSSLGALADSEQRHVTAFEALLATVDYLLEIKELSTEHVHKSLQIAQRHAKGTLGEYAAIYFEDDDQGNTQS